MTGRVFCYEGSSDWCINGMGESSRVDRALKSGKTKTEGTIKG